MKRKSLDVWIAGLDDESAPRLLSLARSIGDKEGRTHQIPKSEIENIRLQPTSTMPEGLEKTMSDQQFVDLIEFLASQKGRAGP